MSLLPRSHTEFQLKEYWDKFFSKRSTPFEWYGEYTDLCHVLHKYLKPSSKVLVVGCGNSKLSEDIYDAGFHAIENIDISDVVIRQMASRNKQKRPKMSFTKMDMLQMTYDNAAFDSVIDKGTLDAIFSNTDDATVEKVNLTFSEIERVLKIAGRYICITLAQEHILVKLLEKFQSGWLLRVHKVVLGVREEEGGVGGALPVFVFVATKMMTVEGKPPMQVYEYVDDDEKCVRCERVDQIGEFVRNHQQYAMIKHHLASLSVGETAIRLDLWSPSVPTEPRYTLSVVDQHKRKAKNGPFAVFIVPQGRETDWLFSSDSGRGNLAESAGFERLVVVTLHRGHTYPSLDAVKEEVAGKAVEFVQQGLPQRKQYPVLSLGDGLGSRVVLHESSSIHSGGYVVEECDGGDPGEGVRVRRLVFISTPHLAQTEMRMIPVKKTAKSAKRSKKRAPQAQSSHAPTVPDHAHLTAGHHRAMVASLALLPCWRCAGEGVAFEAPLNILLVGLGGGALPMFISKYIPNTSLDVVELDSEMVSVAERWFGFSQDREKMRVHVSDGVDFVKECLTAGKRGAYDVVILDVDSKDTSAGMSSPPQVFVEKEFLNNSKELLNTTGMFVTNLAARNKALRSEVLHSVGECYPNLLTLPVPEDVNEVVVALPQDRGQQIETKEGTIHGLSDDVRGSVARLAGSVAGRSGGLLAAKELEEEWQRTLTSLRLYCETNEL